MYSDHLDHVLTTYTFENRLDSKTTKALASQKLKYALELLTLYLKISLQT